MTVAGATFASRPNLAGLETARMFTRACFQNQYLRNSLAGAGAAGTGAIASSLR